MHIILYNIKSNLHSPQQCLRIPSSPHPHQSSLKLLFLVYTHKHIQSLRSFEDSFQITSFFFSVNSHKKNQIKHAWLNFFLIHFISWAFYKAFCILHSKVASYIFAKVLQPCLAEISGQNYYSVQYGGRNKLWVFPKMITNVYIYFLTALQCCFSVSRSRGPLLCFWACFMSQLACKQNHQHTAGHIPTASKTLASLSIFYFLCSPPICSTLLPFEKK